MYLRFTIEKAEHDPVEFSADAWFVETEEIWGRQVEVWEPITSLSIDQDDRSVVIRWADGSEVRDPSWSTFGAEAELAPYVQINGWQR